MKYSLFFYLFLISSYAQALSSNPVFEITNTHMQPAQITTVSKENQIVINVASEFGIGKATIRLVQGYWPEKIVVHLYLQRLEGFNVSNGSMTLERSNLTVKSVKESGYYEVALPPSLFKNGINEVSIQWIDFYR